MRKYIVILLALVALQLACGGSSSGGQQQDITVSLSPKTASVAGDNTQDFMATILNPHNTGVTWSLSGSGCTGAACGTLGNFRGNSNQGWIATYTAPLTVPNPATVTLTATSNDDKTKSDSATITITAPVVSVSVAPSNPTVILGATQQFSATVHGTSNKAVTWAMTGMGSTDANGLYTAPATGTTPGTATVTATSQADTTKSGSAAVTIPAVTVTLSPHVSTVILGATQQFSAAVTNATNTAVTWSMSGPGTLSDSGLYTAPAILPTPATVNVQATSVADPTKMSGITFTIPAVGVSVSPPSPNVILGATQQFTATVTNAMNVAVTWTVTGPGSISNTGLYTAPDSLTTPATATVTATSVADPSKSASAIVNIPAVAVSVSPPTANVIGGGTQPFTATVTNATNAAVTWSVSGLGSIDTSGLYSAPALIPSQTTVTITATSVADPTKSGSATVTLIPISVTVSPDTAMVVITGKKQFTANVSATSNTAVTWSVAANCSAADCGAISSNGRYVAPQVVPGASVTVIATSVADPTKSGTASVQIMPNGNFKLNGFYALYFQGSDPTNNMLAVAGSVHADGNGHLDGGVYDENGVSITDHSPRAIISGTYTVWPDNRGELSWSGNTFRFAMNDTGDRGYFIGFDYSGVHGSGIFKKQTTTDFSLAKFTGNYAFGLSGYELAGYREGIVGRFTANGTTGNLTQTVLDMVSADEGHTRIDNFTGTAAMNAGTAQSYGRGTMTLTASGSTLHTAFYMVNASELFLIGLDPISLSAPLLSGTILAQSPPPFKVTDLNGAAVFHATGNDEPGCTAILIGQWVATPNTTTGSGTLAAEYASNACGNSTPLANFTATYSIDVSGRTNLMATSGAVSPFYYYMVGPNKAFLVSSDPYVMTGMFEPQTIPNGGFTNASMLADYFLGTIDHASPFVIAASGVENFDGANTWTSMEDASDPQGGNYGDLAGTGSYNITNSDTGRGTIIVPGAESNSIVFYAVAPGKFYNFVLNYPDRIAESEQQ